VARERAGDGVEHGLNDAFCKALLGLCTGSVLHATRERSLGKLGGLIHRMPWVAWCALIGSIAIAGLPPLNGFVSEWLLLQAFLLTPGLPQTYLNMLVPVAAAVVALTAALSGYVMVKFYGVVFLAQGWLFLAPLQPERASYSPLLFFAVTALLVALTWLAVRVFYHGRSRRAAPWDCGFPRQNARMQDSAEGFGQPVRHVFEPFFRVEQHAPAPTDARPTYSEVHEDRLWYWLYLPVARGVERLTGLVTFLQRGRISVYLTYSFATLLVLLLFVG